MSDVQAIPPDPTEPEEEPAAPPVETWPAPERPTWFARALPWLCGGAVGIGAVALWWALQRHESALIQRTLEVEASRVSNQAVQRIEAHAHGLVSMARRWESRDSVTDRDWKVEAQATLLRASAFRALAWCSDSLLVRWSVPSSAREINGALDPRDDEARAQALAGAFGASEAFAARTLPVSDGHRQVLIAAPLFRRERIGFLVGVMRTRDLIDTIVLEDIARGFAVAVYEGPYLIYGPPATLARPAERWTAAAEVQVNELAWRFSVWPSDELLNEMRSSAPDLALAIGLLLAVVVGVAVQLLESSRRRIVELEAFGRSREAGRAGRPEDEKAPHPEVVPPPPLPRAAAESSGLDDSA